MNDQLLESTISTSVTLLHSVIEQYCVCVCMCVCGCVCNIINNNLTIGECYLYKCNSQNTLKIHGP